MSRRKVALATGGFVALLMAFYLITAAFVYPAALPLTGAGGSRAPTSTLATLPEYVNTHIIPVEYVSNGSAGESGVFWTELWYRIPGVTDWTPYAPPWNPSGRWYGALGFDSSDLVEGTILFDTFYAGGEAVYEFSSVAVDRGYWAEAPPGPAKAKTTLDTRPPQLFIASPTPGAWTREKTLRWVATDAVSGVASVEYDLDGAFVKATPDASGSEPLGLEAQGGHALVVRAKDRAGNVAEVSVPFRYDPNAPHLAITAPERDSVTKDASVNVTWEAGDDGAGVAALRLTLDSNPPVDLAGTATWHVLEDVDEKGHLVNLVATDGAGNIAAQSLSFFVDRTAPQVTIHAPRDATYVAQRNVLVIWTATDAISGITGFELGLEGRTPVPVTDAAAFVWDNVPDGARAFTVRATDRAGNVGEARVDVTVDATAPTVQITKPSAGDTVYGSLEIGWTATDPGSGVKTVEIVYDDGLPVVATGATTHTVGGALIGPHFVLVRVTDNAGNVNEVGRAFAYGGVSPPGPSPFNIGALDFWILMAIIGAIAVGSAYYAVRRRKRSQA